MVWTGDQPMPVALHEVVGRTEKLLKTLIGEEVQVMSVSRHSRVSS